MQDRVPLYPGRVKLTPVSGQENVYDMVRADQPTQPGDPLNKATLLKDATAALFGLGTDAVPDDMLNALAHTGDLHVWKRTQSGVVDYPVSPNPDAYQAGNNGQPAGYTLGEVQSGQFRLNGMYNYGETVTVNDDGVVTVQITGSANITSGSSSDIVSLLKGKFVSSTSEIFYVPSDAEVGGIGTNPYISKKQSVTGYPAIPADTTIEYMSQLGDKARIVTGSYVGTGQYGSENPNSLTFEFAPKILFIIASMGASSSVGEHMWKAEFYLNGVFSSYKSNGYFLRNDTSLLNSGSLFSMLNSGGKSVLWYGSDARTQLNATEETYYYTAIG